MLKNCHIHLSLIALLALSGCGLRKKSPQQRNNDLQHEVDAQGVDFAICDESFRSMYNDDLDEFDPATQVETGNVQEQAPYDLHEFTWVEDTENADGFKNVCFGYDRHHVTPDQEAILAHNIELIKCRLAENPTYQPTIVVEGHSCHSAGQTDYNLALSEQRAKIVYDRMVEAGIPAECIKIVGRGDHIPAIINGVEVTGDRIAQAPNRRCETRIIYA